MRTILVLLMATLVFTTKVNAQEVSALTCDDFRPTQEALERFPNLVGACESIVEREGELYGLFRAVVRRASGSSVTLYLPATDKTFVTRPDPSYRVLLDGKKTRARDLARGQEIQVYLAASEFSKPNVEEVAFVTEENAVVTVLVEDVPALPTTASIWPTIGAAGLFLFGIGCFMRRRRIAAVAPLLVLLGFGTLMEVPTAQAEVKEIEVPAKVVTSAVRSVAIVEAVNKETRELKLINAQGHRFTIVASDQVTNFDQIEARDRIVADYLESIAIYVVPAGAPQLDDVAVAVEVKEAGDKPGVAAVGTVLLKANVESLNKSDRLATLRLEDGSIRVVKISSDVALDMISVGDEFRLRITHAMAVSVNKAPT